MQRKKISVIVLGLFITNLSAIQAKQSESPYLANPVALHRYINKTVPNIAIIVDNSNIMNEPMASQHKDENPRYIDVVKDALMKVYPDTYGTHNLALITLTDAAKDMHWKVDQSQPSGYLFASGINNDNIFYSNEPNFNPYDIAPIASDGTLQRSVGSGNGKQNYGFNKFKDSRLVGGVQTYQTYVPGWNEQQKNTLGMTLLVPLLTQFNSNHVFQQQQENLNLLTKTISLGEGRIRDVLPQTVDYLVKNIKYRCQNSYILVITNDISEVMDDVNRKAIGQYAKNHPKSSDETDAEGYLFNQLDFPDQYVQTSLLALNTKNTSTEWALNSQDVRAFAAIGAGRGVVANDDEDIILHLKEFMREMSPKSLFTGSAPAVYVGINPDTNEEEQVWVTSVSEPDGWFGHIRVNKTLEEEAYSTMRYAQGYPDVYLNTGKDVVYLSLFGSPSGIVKPRNTLSSADFGLPITENVSDFISWLIGEHPIDGGSDYFGDSLYPQYRSRSDDAFSGKRYLGDITNDTVEILGTYSSSINAPGMLVVGSNDGMLKVYRANPFYNMQPEPNKPGLEELDEPFPYVYEFAYMPGGAKRSDGSKLMEHYKYRADPAYGDESKYPVHEYGISGQIAYRTTNKNQTFMVGTLGQGGFGAFALNIAGRAHHDQSQKLGVESMPKPSWGENSFLWDTNSNAFGAAQEGSEAIGHILGRPVIARVAMSRSSGIPNMKKDVRYVAVLPSGEFGDQNKDPEPTLYIYDALGVNVGINQNKKDITAGKLIRKVSAQLPKGISLKYRNSLSAPTLVDLTFDGVADIGYVGDLNGHLYRLDLRGDNPDAWTLKLIYEGSDKYPITQAPSVSRYDRKNVVIFGTGSYTKKDDFNGHIVQNAIYGIFENDTFTAFQDEPLTAHSNFIDQTLSHDMNKMTRSISNHEVDKEHIGWRILLSNTAREGLSQKPVVFNGTVFFQTYVLHDKQAMPDNAMCYRPALSPDTWLFQINARTGAILNEDKDTRLEEMGKEHAIQFDGTILPTLKLVRTDQSSSTSKDGEMQNGNDPDFELVELESLPNNNLLNKGHYLNEEGICNAIVTNGMTLVCPPYKQVLTPGRLSIMKHSAK